MEFIDGFDDYAVSWLGEVFRIKPAKGGASRSCSRIPYRLKPVLMGSKSHQYLSVLLRGRDGRYRRVPVHCLVIATFKGPAPEIPQGCYEIIHLDGDRMNNRADNLAWVLRSKNPKRRRAREAKRISTAAPLLREAA
ncbi:MAG TPA: HNH endonuclease [Candidatus Binataceae bacterium]|nr:HNH endonuclease [Candidatus Binataceae bacterium]